MRFVFLNIIEFSILLLIKRICIDYMLVENKRIKQKRKIPK